MWTKGKCPKKILGCPVFLQAKKPAHKPWVEWYPPIFKIYTHKENHHLKIKIWEKKIYNDGSMLRWWHADVDGALDPWSCYPYKSSTTVGIQMNYGIYIY